MKYEDNRQYHTHIHVPPAPPPERSWLGPFLIGVAAVVVAVLAIDPRR